MAGRIVRQHGEQLQSGGEADAGAPHVRHAAHAEGRRHVGDLLGLRQAADRADVGLDDVDRALRQHLAEIPAREPGLAAGDRDRLAAAHLDVARQVIGHHRLLEPADVAVGDRAAELDRLDRVVAVVGVEHQADAGPTASRQARISAASWATPKPILSFTAEKPSRA